MTVNLTENGFYLNGLRIENKQTEYTDVIDLLGRNYRDIALKYDITLIIFDDAGIRFWVENNKVTQLQIVLSDVKTGDKFPNNVYSGKIVINGREQTLPISLEAVKQSGGDSVWDDDSKRFGVNILYLMLDKSKFPLQFDSEAGFVEYISS